MWGTQSCVLRLKEEGVGGEMLVCVQYLSSLRGANSQGTTAAPLGVYPNIRGGSKHLPYPWSEVLRFSLVHHQEAYLIAQTFCI
jgi:hypothetical protein